jgi:hypothetical protein
MQLLGLVLSSEVLRHCSCPGIQVIAVHLLGVTAIMQQWLTVVLCLLWIQLKCHGILELRHGIGLGTSRFLRGEDCQRPFYSALGLDRWALACSNATRCTTNTEEGTMKGAAWNGREASDWTWLGCVLHAWLSFFFFLPGSLPSTLCLLDPSL